MRRWWGLGAAVVLVAAAVLLPRLFDFDPVARSAGAGGISVPPLHGTWEPLLLGPGTLPALVIGVLGVWLGHDLASRMRWGHLLLASYVVGLAWMLALATTDGWAGISHVMADPYEYGDTARSMGDVPAALHVWVDRIDPDTPGHWATHVAGHPPLATLFFVGLVRLGLGSNLQMGLAVTLLAATAAPAVLATVRRLGAEDVARRAAPFLVLGPAAVLMAVSADAVFTAVAAWGLAALAFAATATGRWWWAWAVLAGALLGACVLLSYGLPLLGFLALAVLAAARSWRALPVAAATAGLLVLGLVPLGFSWWEAYPALHDRYWRGLAKLRPFAYWGWANLAALVIAAGPLLGAGLTEAWARRRESRATFLLVAGAGAAIVVADLSRMSKAEVERIWLPFVPWLLLSTALLPARWRGVGLAAQVAAAIVLEQLIATTW